MRHIDQLALTKYATETPTPMAVLKSLPVTPLGVAGGAATVSPFLPWNTFGALYDKARGTDRKDQMPQSLVTDAGRGIGAALGAGSAFGLARSWHLPNTSRLARLAILLGGTGVGGFLGHRQGKQIGQGLFPGSFSERTQRALHNL